MAGIPQVITEDRASGALVIDGSLKFDSSKSTYLQRTQVGGNRRTFTWSGWIKRTDSYNSGNHHDWFSASEGDTTSGGDYGFGLRFSYNKSHGTHPHQLMVFEYENSAFKLRLISDQVFRDFNNFYHMVIAVDTTIASPSSDRVKVYVNGERITNWKSGYESYPSQNLELTVNESGKTSQIGCSVDESGVVQQADGYASNFYLIDGQQLGPENFGYTDPLTNTWRPKKYEGTFGTNGFYVPMDGNTLIGKDQSGNGNDWTPVNFGGSVDLPRATGAIPILNTNEGGTVAKNGVRTDSKTYTVTASGGKYYLDGVETPTLNFLRGGTYIFDYTAASGHPFKFSTTSDGTHGGGSEYTDGTNTSTTNVMKITVPHNAPDTLYYYCSAHSGMGSSINVTTDIRKADPYAWKCVLALPMLSKDDVSASINVNSTTKTTSINGNAEARSERWDLYGGAFYFDSSNDWIQATPTSGSTLANGTGPYTIEFFFSINSGRFTDNTYNILFTTSSGLTVAKWRSGISNKVYFESDGNATGWSVQTQQNISANTWYHFAAVRDGNTIKTYLDGVLQGTATATYTAGAETYWRIGDNGNGQSHAGYMQDLRIYNGVAKYTEDFSRVSTTPDVLPDTPSGVSGKSKLTKITDGAVYFDGSSEQHIDAGSALIDTSSNFCVEAFAYLLNNPTSSDMGMICSQYASGTPAGRMLYGFQDGYLALRINGTTVQLQSAAGSVGSKRWYHTAWTWDGTTHRLFLDGKLVDSSTSVPAPYTGTNTEIGGNSALNAYDIKGYISNFRIVTGSAVYTGDFTPPTEKLTNITNTSLLCCQSNTHPGAAVVGPRVSGVNNGTGWSSNFTSDSLFRSGFPAWKAFNGTTKSSTNDCAATPQTAGQGFTFTFGGGVPFTTLQMQCDPNGSLGATVKANGVDITSQLTSGSLTNTTITGVTSPLTSLSLVSRGGDAGYLGSVTIDGTMLVDPLIRNTSTIVATNFNPLTDDINAIRGQETGYATLNPLLKGANTALSNGNLTVSSSGSTFDGFATGTILIPKTGKWFVEFTAGSVVSSTYYGMYNTRTWNPNGFSGTGFFGLQVDTGNKFKSTGQSSYGSAVTLGDVVGVMYDADNNTIGFMKNGTNYGVAFDNSDGIDYTDDHRVWWNTNAATNFSHTINFGQKPFKFPPPDGFQPLNLSTVQPEKLITRPDQYVGVSLWSGNGTSQNITGLKHKPDFVWIKKRAGGSTRSHQLFDSVRGVHKSLHSDSTNTEDTNTGRLTAFNQDGFAVGGDDGANGSSGTFVGWTWKAGGNKNTFNIDDVGYANASDVNMNVGAFNNYNTSRVWSSGIANSSGDFDQPATNAFNGDRSNKLRTGGNAVLVTLNFSPALTVANTIQILGEDYATANFRYTVTVDGTTTTKDVDQGQPATFNVSGSLTQITFVNNNSNGRTYLEWIKVDGKELIDSNVTINTPSIAPTGCSVGTKQGFSIVKWQGDGSNANRTVPHGLLEAPSFIIVKPLTEARHWLIWHKGYNDDDAAMLFDTGIPAGSRFGPQAPTSNVFGVYGGQGNRGTTDFIGYCWHDVPGLQKFGTYTGNGIFDGPFVDLGFQPAIIWFKNISDGSNRHWCVVDSRRTTHNKSGSCEVLFPDSNQIESRPDDGFGQFGNKTCVDILSNGFKLREPNSSGVWTQVNNTHNYIYCAWAEAPSINLYGAQSNAF